MDKIAPRFFVSPTNYGENFDFGKGDTVPIDQQPAASFNIDPSTGAPISDIKVIVRSQGIEQERLLSNLQQFREEFLPEDMSNEDALKFACPRLCQMPSELAEFSEFVSQKKMEELKLKKEAEEYEQSIKDFEEFQKAQRAKEEEDKKKQSNVE